MPAGPRYTRHVRQFHDFTDSKYQQVRQYARPGCFSSSPIKSPLGIIISMKEQAHSCSARAPYRSDFLDLVFSHAIHGHRALGIWKLNNACISPPLGAFKMVLLLSPGKSCRFSRRHMKEGWCLSPTARLLRANNIV